MSLLTLLLPLLGALACSGQGGEPAAKNADAETTLERLPPFEREQSGDANSGGGHPEQPGGQEQLDLGSVVSPEDAAAGASAVHELCRRIGAKLSSVSERECERRSLVATGAETVLGAPIVRKDHLASDQGSGRILLLGGIHGDEYSSVTISFKWLAALEAETQRKFHWRVLPLLNPDGLLRTASQRMNHRGVDLNRNFPTPNWEEETKDYWVRRTGKNPRRYPGPAALSEPESRFLYEEIKKFKPDLIIAVHAPLEVVDFDGPATPPEKLGALYLQRMGTYPGSLGRYGSEELGLPVLTIELPSAGTMPPKAEQARIWSDLKTYIDRTLGEDLLKPATSAE